MNILALEASTDACSAALMTGNRIISRHELAPQRHAELLLPMIESLLDESECDMSVLDAIAFSRGPGSFTGLRIAAGVVQGLAFATGCPVIPVSTLAVLAQGVWHEHQQPCVLAGLDARLGEVYWGVFRYEDGIMRASADERVCLPDEVPLPADAEFWYGAGSAWKSYGGILAQRFADRVVHVDGDHMPSARDMMPLAQHALAQGRTVSPEQAIPVYLRDNIAVKQARQPG